MLLFFLDNCVIPIVGSFIMIVLTIQYPSYIMLICTLIGCPVLLIHTPRGLILLKEIFHKDALLSSPNLSFRGYDIFFLKNPIPVVLDNDSQITYDWLTPVSTELLEHVAYVIYYPKSRVVVNAIIIEDLTSNPLIHAVFFSEKQAAIREAQIQGSAEQDYTGRTALHWAYRKHLQQVIPVLISRGASEDSKDFFGLLPCDLRKDGIISERSNNFPQEWLRKKELWCRRL